jgi:hypothetical protein
MRVTDWTVSELGENTGRVMFAKNTASSTAAGGARDDTLDRSYDYDNVAACVLVQI